MIASFVQGTPGFAEALERLRDRGETDFAKVEPQVREILDAVRGEGDRAVLRFVERFERRAPRSLLVAARDLDGEGALRRLAPEAREALTAAAERIKEF
ncbi:MAG TPA: histidinol dehydrogenase, partial [Labilithrix sp.]|nr:histidinol dehydrogenase [Labilithrix sp.]